jgi:hypothetical protein
MISKMPLLVWTRNTKECKNSCKVDLMMGTSLPLYRNWRLRAIKDRDSMALSQKVAMEMEHLPKCETRDHNP